MRSLLSNRAVDQLADLAHVAFEAVHHDDQGVADDDDQEVADDENSTSCDCSLTTLLSSLSLNLD